MCVGRSNARANCGVGFEFAFVKDDGRVATYGCWCVVGFALSDVPKWKFEAINKGYEGGNVKSPLLTCYNGAHLFKPHQTT